MYKAITAFVLVLFVTTILVTPVLFMPSRSTNIESLNILDTKNNKKENLPTVMKTATAYSGVQFTNTVFTNELVLSNDSRVTISDSLFTETTSVQLYDNATLILDNVTSDFETRFYLYDDASLIILNSNISVTTSSAIFLYDTSSLELNNSEFRKTALRAQDYATISVYNTTIGLVEMRDNSVISAYKVTGYNTL